MSTVSRSRAASAFRQESTLVALESSMKVTPFASNTRSMRCATPLKEEKAETIASFPIPISRAAARAARGVFEVVLPLHGKFLRAHHPLSPEV